MLNPTLLHVHEEEQEYEACQTQRKEEVEWRGVVPCVIYDGRGNEWTNEGTGLANDAEERKEQEFPPSGSHFADHLFTR